MKKKLNDSITSSFVQKGGSKYYSATSSIAQKGSSNGLSSAKENTEAEVNQLISMLTSEFSEVNNNNSTETVALENKLKNMLQEGGARKKRSQRGGANEEVKQALNIFTTNSGTNSESSILGGILQPKVNNDTSTVNTVLSPSKMSSTSEVPLGPSKRITPTKVIDSATSSAVPASVTDATTSEVNAIFMPVNASKKVVDSVTSSIVPNIAPSDLSSTSASKKNNDLSPTSSQVPKAVVDLSPTSSPLPKAVADLSPTSVTSNGSSANTTTSVGDRSLLDVLGETVTNGFRSLGKMFEEEKKPNAPIKGGAKKNSKKGSKKGSKKISKRMSGGAKKNSKGVKKNSKVAKKGKGRK